MAASEFSCNSYSYEQVIRPNTPEMVFHVIPQKMGFFKLLKEKIVMNNRFGYLAALIFASVGSAVAAVPVGVTTAITDAGADAATMGAAVLVVIVGIAAFKYMRRVL